MSENLTAPIYHGFLPPYSREKQIDLFPQLYTPKKEKIHLAFKPLCPDCENSPQWENWNRYRSILFIGWPDCEQLLIPTLKQIFPVTDPTSSKVQEEFDPCFDNWIGKQDLERWMHLILTSLPNLTAEEADFLDSILGWIKTALTHASIIIIESNL